MKQDFFVFYSYNTPFHSIFFYQNDRYETGQTDIKMANIKVTGGKIADVKRAYIEEDDVKMAEVKVVDVKVANNLSRIRIANLQMGSHLKVYSWIRSFD